MGKTEAVINKPVYLGQSILDICNIAIHEFWYVKPKYREKDKLCCMDTDSFIIQLQTKDIGKDIAKNVETRFDSSSCKLERPH